MPDDSQTCTLKNKSAISNYDATRIDEKKRNQKLCEARNSKSAYALYHRSLFWSKQ